MAERQRLGAWGEDVAAQHLQAAGLSVLARNWRCREGEIDLVAREPDGTLVFVEVKTRRGLGFGEPAEAVTLAKARRLRVLACRWLASERSAGRSRPGPGDLRFDVVSVLVAGGRVQRVTHLRAAF